MRDCSTRLYPAVIRGTSCGLVWLALLCGGLLASGARAQAPEQGAERRALVLFEAAELRYQEGRFADAIALLEEAWAIHPVPPILYNLGRAHEELGDAARALDAYRRYLAAEPGSPARTEVQERIRALEAGSGVGETVSDLRPDSETETDPDPDPDSDPDPDPETDPDPDPDPEPDPVAVAPATPRPSAGRSIVPFVVAGAGVAVLGGGLVCGLLSDGAEDTARTERVHLEARDAYRRAKTFATLANVGVIAGSVLLATGALWIALDSGDSAETEPAFEVSLGPAGVAVRGAFE
jgi:tetratricopeptide (TPR) repeat protein